MPAFPPSYPSNFCSWRGWKAPKYRSGEEGKDEDILYKVLKIELESRMRRQIGKKYCPVFRCPDFKVSALITLNSWIHDPLA